MYLIGKTPALVLGTTATFAFAGAAAPLPAIAAEVRAAQGDAPRPPRPDGPRPPRHHFAAPSMAAALVPETPMRAARAAREVVGATA